MRVCTHALYVCAFSMGTSGCSSGNMSHLCEYGLLESQIGTSGVWRACFLPFPSPQGQLVYLLRASPSAFSCSAPGSRAPGQGSF